MFRLSILHPFIKCIIYWPNVWLNLSPKIQFSMYQHLILPKSCTQKSVKAKKLNLFEKSIKLLDSSLSHLHNHYNAINFLIGMVDQCIELRFPKPQIFQAFHQID
ncbi:unnamed protein product (macronuclear) [Paramecium tetraurelia]|uniref:Uncharacterized protein n=1 Tax=Paramecium tetraurelia TaxID=5888 RepID=A0C8V6_PARTE|nr:uncharacterized protein GSPATT00036358001 [Paramecium tetraurelia]CAK67223.1 unnamed protein product [Paramecium tetraurelia]|eukprot:XP_001434620.1 hypothetical protein (macronuclear) [Paramecium tetraurelia strain d4-2]